MRFRPVRTIQICEPFPWHSGLCWHRAHRNDGFYVVAWIPLNYILRLGYWLLFAATCTDPLPRWLGWERRVAKAYREGYKRGVEDGRTQMLRAYKLGAKYGKAHDEQRHSDPSPAGPRSDRGT